MVCIRRRGANISAAQPLPLLRWVCCLCVISIAAAAPAGFRGSPGSSAETETYETSWDSSPFNLDSITDNNLGLLAKSCAEQYCHAGINGLDLWISLEEVRFFEEARGSYARGNQPSMGD